MAENLKFKIATEHNLSTLNTLYADMNDKQLMTQKKILEIWQQIQQVPNYYIYLAYLDNKAMSLTSFAIGTFSLLFMPTMMHPGFHKSAILDSVTILSSYRSKGYGKQMMRQALEISADAGCYKVTLSSNLQREEAHKFYQSLGFQQHGWSYSYLLSMNNR